METHTLGGTMIDPLTNLDSIDSLKLTPEMKTFLNETRSKLNGCERRKFMAKVVQRMGKGGQRRAERELGWNRRTIQKGTYELTTGFDCVDNVSSRGRHRIEIHLPNLLEDIRQIVTPVSQCDPTFCTTDLYSPLTASEVFSRLVNTKHYTADQLPTVRTIRTKLNELGFRLKKVAKCNPQKK